MQGRLQGQESTKMSSIPGLPASGSDVIVLITRVNLNPLCPNVELWGNFNQERKADYQCLSKDIQFPTNKLAEFEGSPGELCLVQVDETWYRSRIVSRNGSNYKVFLIDKGWTLSATTSMLAWGKKEFFHLPPEVEFCVLANVLPLSHESKWSPMALEFLKTLNWKTVKAHVQNVMVPQRTIVLHIPSISKQMYEMGFAKKLSPEMFSDFLLKTLQSPSRVAMPTELHQESMRNEQPGTGLATPSQQRFMYPELQMGTVETVIVTEVTNPMRVFCQLKVFAQELKKVTEQITLYYEGRFTPCVVTSNMLGFPCAARGSDGRWYRSVLQQILPADNVVEVLNVDYGKKQLVQVENIRPLAAEFFRMPVVTYVCSLHGVTDKGLGWTAAQIEYLKSLILYKTVIAKFEYQSLCEGVHYVTLYGDEKTSINSLFGSQEKCLLECEKSLLTFDVRSPPSRLQHPAQRESQGIVPVEAAKDTKGKNMQKLLAEDLSLDSSHVAVVHHVSSPFEFWIQTQKYADEFDELMENMDSLYSDLATTDLIRNPTVGLYCAAKAQDGAFYRATVTEVSNAQVNVSFVDYGNTERIDRNCIRVLPEKFKELPQLALKCCLAGIKPKDETWSRSAVEFFIKAVVDKVLNVHVTAKCDGAYIIQLTDSSAHGEQDVNKLLCNSGIAESDVSPKRPNAKRTTSPVLYPVKSKPAALPLRGNENSEIPSQTPNLALCTKPAPLGSGPATFKELMFPIGTAIDVNVSYIESPNDFWCQLCQNKGQLNLLMQEMQMFYDKSQFQPFAESTCVARHPHNKMWYRALVLNRDTTQHVDVLFIDYGQRKRVPLHELRKINPSFLNMKGQAFRCSLYNPVKPTSPMNDWDEVATAEFQDFVDAAASSHVILKCTIYAVMYNEQNVVFNIVDLETPFESACTRMVHHTTIASLSKEPASTVRFDTYYYSTHNIKTGTEENVTVTCVSNVNKFYCQLERNAGIVKDLELKVNGLCDELKGSKLPTTFGMLCFAKYPDGKWYRGQVKAVQPSVRVHFVDYGDTLNVDPSDLLPIPREACDIISVPVQAIECGLSDIPAKVPSEVNSWFETNATEQPFRALVVAQHDGKLQVELYHGKTQINATIKQRFCIDVQSHGRSTIRQHPPNAFSKPTIEMEGTQATNQCPKFTSNAQHSPNAFSKPTTEMEGTQATNQCPKFTSNAQHSPNAFSKPTTEMEGTQATKTNQCPVPKVRGATLEPYRTPQQRQLDGSTQNSTQDYAEPVGVNNRHPLNPFSEQKCSEGSKLPSLESQKKSYSSFQPEVETLPKLTDLPTKSIELGMEADVFVSHSNSPLSFYVQLACDEAHICSIVSKLNDGQPSTETIKYLQPGDLVQAEFPDDDAWYRAVVREVRENKTALVEFVDFGNSCEVPRDNIRKLDKTLLQFPAYSTQCLLSGAAVFQHESKLDPNLVSSFKKNVATDGEKVFKCFFIRRSGSVWEVNLEDGGVDIMCTISTRISNDSPVHEHPEPLELGGEAGLSERRSREASDSFDATVKPVFISDARKEDGEQTKDLGAPELDKDGLPKLTDLPAQSITAGTEADIFVMHCNNPLSFYVHLVKDQADLISIVDKLNDGESSAESGNIKDLHSGDLIIAEFPDDNSWYRAVVREIHANKTALVEFVDYGNSAVVSLSKMCTLSKPFLRFPRFSTHCVLSGAAAIKEELVLDPEVVSSFEEEVGPSTDKVLKCQFIRQVESVWEVRLEDGGVEITCKIPTGSLTPCDDVTPKISGDVDEKPCHEDKQNTDRQEELIVPEAAVVETCIEASPEDSGVDITCKIPTAPLTPCDDVTPKMSGDVDETPCKEDEQNTDQQGELFAPEAANVAETCIEASPEDSRVEISCKIPTGSLTPCDDVTPKISGDVDETPCKEDEQNTDQQEEHIVPEAANVVETCIEASPEDSRVEISCKIPTGSLTPCDDVTPKISGDVDETPCKEDEQNTDQQEEHIVPEAANVVETCIEASPEDGGVEITCEVPTGSLTPCDVTPKISGDVDEMPCQKDEQNTDQQEEHIVPETADVCIEASPESAESAPTTEADLGAQEEEVIVAEKVQTVAPELESVPDEPETHTEGNDSAAVLESEFGPLKAAKTITVGSTRVVWSPVVKSWCKARVLKSTSDSILVVLIDCDTQMDVEPCSVFDLFSGHEECGDAGSSDYATTSIVIASEPNPVQSESPLSHCEPFEKLSDASAKQDVETKDCEEKILSVFTPHKCDNDDSTDTVSTPMSLEEDTLDEQSDTSDDTITMDDLIDFDAPEDSCHDVQTESPQSPCVPSETFIDALAEHEVKAEDVAEEAQSVGTHHKNDLMIDEEMRSDDEHSSDLVPEAEMEGSEQHADDASTETTVQTESPQSPCVPSETFIDALAEHEVKAEDVAEEAQSVGTHHKNDLMIDEEMRSDDEHSSDLVPEAEMEGSEQHADDASTETTIDLVIEEEMRCDDDEHSSALLAETEPATCEPQGHSDPRLNMDDVCIMCLEAACSDDEYLEAACSDDEYSDLEPEAEMEGSEQHADDASTETTDLAEDVSKEESSRSPNSLEAQLSMVTHLCLVVEDEPDDVVIFEKEISPAQQQKDDQSDVVKE